MRPSFLLQRQHFPLESYKLGWQSVSKNVRNFESISHVWIFLEKFRTCSHKNERCLFSMIHSLTHSSHTFAFEQLRFPLNIKRQRKGLLHMEHCLLNKRFPKRVKCFWSTWTLLCNITIWCIWIERKDPCFNNCKLDRCIWEGQVDYGRIEWAKALREIASSPSVKQAFFKEFDETLCPHHAICARDNYKVWWSYHMSSKCNFY